MYKIIGGDGQPYGPVNADQVRRWMAEGRVSMSTLIQPEGAQEWKPLRDFPEFASQTQAPPFLGSPGPFGQSPNPAIAARASSKLPAGICGIMLGGLGIHKFILGYNTAGIIMLLVSVLSCGIAYAVMHVIGLVEGILYLTKSDEDFVRTYVDNRKEWF